jgi:hypothetical protein
MSWYSFVAVVVGVFLVVFAWEVGPKAVQHWARLSREVREREAFVASGDMDTLAARYPTFMTSVVADTVDALSRGALWPTLEHAWDTNSLVYTARAMATWFAGNPFVRLFSPQSTWEYVATVVFFSALLYVFANLTASAIASGNARHRQELKYASRSATAAAFSVADD